MNLYKLNEISKIFNIFKDNPNSIYKIVNSIKTEELKDVLEYYSEKEKHYKIDKVVAARFVLIKKLLRGKKLNDGIVNNVKEKIKREARKNNYNKDIFHSWNPNWRILFPIYYHKYRHLVITSLKIIADRLINDLKLEGIVNVTINDFNGAQNFGSSGCWFSIYNDSHDSQRTALQLFFLLRNGKIKYGLYDFRNKSEKELINCNLKDVTYEKILEKYSNYIELIKNDKSIQKTKLSPNRKRKGKQSININGYLRKPIESTFVKQKHKEVQKIYLETLQNIYGEKNVILEENYIDIKVETKNVINLYEVKTYNNAIHCIRDAIGQLLLYACRLKEKTKKQINLIVVGLGEDNLDSEEFKKYLLDNFNFNFKYEYFKYD